MLEVKRAEHVVTQSLCVVESVAHVVNVSSVVGCRVGAALLRVACGPRNWLGDGLAAWDVAGGRPRVVRLATDPRNPLALQVTQTFPDEMRYRCAGYWAARGWRSVWWRRGRCGCSTSACATRGGSTGV